MLCNRNGGSELRGSSIDLNADVGELPANLADGSEERLLQLVSSANIACGGHAGSAASMRAVVALCVKHGVAAGAHPSYPDPDHFGRLSLRIAPEVLEDSLHMQVAALDAVVRAAGGVLRHIKPHGALYTDAARDPVLAACIARAVQPWKASAVLVGLAGSRMLDIWQEQGFRIAAEAFADRTYESDGTLRSRQLPGALITDPEAAAAQALSLAVDQRAKSLSGDWIPVAAATLCLHGDSPQALSTAHRIRSAFASHGVDVVPLAGPG